MLRNLVVYILLSTLLAGSAVSQRKPSKNVKHTATAVGSIAFTGQTGSIHSMDSNNSTYSYIEIANGTIASFKPPAGIRTGKKSGQRARQTENVIQIPPGAAIYPGFIDSHSHMITFGVPLAVDSNNQPYWINLASVNVLLQPACSSGSSTLTCFTPIHNQAKVDVILHKAKPNSIGWVLGFNYEPARLACTVNGQRAYGFTCQSFANPGSKTTPRQILDGLNNTAKVLVTSESGHIVYANSKALQALNICGTSFSSGSGCQQPFVNPQAEEQLAQEGQLDEDLALYAEAFVQAQILKAQPSALSQMIATASKAYSRLGITTAQEGAASLTLIKAYAATSAAGSLPLRLAALDYIAMSPSSSGFATQVESGASLQQTLAKNTPDVFIAGIKLFADGSNQGYTGAFASPDQYMNQHLPFTNQAIFPAQPYEGVADLQQSDLTAAIQAAHQNGFPLWVHANGTVAQTNTLTVMEANQQQGLRDVVVHFTTPTQQQVQSIPAANMGVTFLMNDFYYYYQPLCQQIVGPTAAATANLYPAAWAAAANIHFGLHSDTAVTPPSPLFGMWVATTRSVQSPSWIPPMSNSDPCQAGIQNQNQAISRLQAMKAYTSDAAWLYSRDTTNNNVPGIGSLQIGNAGDLVVLTADPLDPSTDLSTVNVLYTVHNGKIVYNNSSLKNPVIWPN